MKNHFSYKSYLVTAIYIWAMVTISCNKDISLEELKVEGIIFNPELTYGTVTDIEGNIYNSIQIGTQTWIAENLKTTKYNDGSDIPLFTGMDWWGAIHRSGYGWYNDSVTNKAVYGALYNHNAIRTGKVCPAGWHVSTDSDWKVLTDYLGGDSIAGGKLKEAGTLHWISPNTGATNQSGFTALPGGWNSDGEFARIRMTSSFWSPVDDTSYMIHFRPLSYSKSTVMRAMYWEGGRSVRCVRDN